jgi:DNA-binding beta-propeller fold protein YncE
VASIPLSDDADNIRYDAARKRIVVGYGGGALAMIDPATKAVVGTVPLTSHPESFQIEASGARAWVNLPSSHAVGVVDLGQRKEIGTYSLGMAAANFPMVLDEGNHRLFVGCRLPARFLVFDTETGKRIAELPFHGDCDDLFYDAARKQIYASCGEGFLDVISQADADHYSIKESIPSAPGARTAFFDGDNLYLAVPHRGEQRAEIRVYRAAR